MTRRLNQQTTSNLHRQFCELFSHKANNKRALCHLSTGQVKVEGQHTIESIMPKPGLPLLYNSDIFDD